jgi:hypothetical protein
LVSARARRVFGKRDTTLGDDVTYPPQQPGQPQGPYGQQPQGPPPGFTPQTGPNPTPPPGFPPQGVNYPPPVGYQQPAAYPPPAGYPQQGGYPPPPQQFQGPVGPGGPAPRGGSKAVPLVLGIIGVVIVAVVLVGGFAWPGWFSGGSGGNGGGGQAGAGFATSADLFAALSKDATSHDAGAINAMKCPGSEVDNVDDFVKATKVTQVGKVTNSGPNAAVAKLEVETPAGAELYGVGATNQLTGSWCLASLGQSGAAN